MKKNTGNDFTDLQVGHHWQGEYEKGAWKRPGYWYEKAENMKKKFRFVYGPSLYTEMAVKRHIETAMVPEDYVTPEERTTYGLVKKALYTEPLKKKEKKQKADLRKQFVSDYEELMDELNNI